MMTKPPRNNRAKPEPAKLAPPTLTSVEKQLSTFIAKFEPKDAKLIRTCRAEMRKLLPTAIELVYDNYNFFVIGYGPTERSSEAIFSVAAAANGVGLAFLKGASLPDPEKILQGNGKVNRFIRLPTTERFRSPPVLALIKAAVGQSKVPFPASGGGYTVIKSVSAKQRPRRRSK
jgi:hypothetical protein